VFIRCTGHHRTILIVFSYKSTGWCNHRTTCMLSLPVHSS
jgi:hypothetical protein